MALWVYKILTKSQNAMCHADSKVISFIYILEMESFHPIIKICIITRISFIIILPLDVTFHLLTSELWHTGPPPPGQTTMNTVPQVAHWLTEQKCLLHPEINQWQPLMTNQFIHLTYDHPTNTQVNNMSYSYQKIATKQTKSIKATS